MRRTELLQEVRKRQFEEACGGWQERRLIQEEAARRLGGGVSARPAPAKAGVPALRGPPSTDWGEDANMPPFGSWSQCMSTPGDSAMGPREG